MWAGIEYAAQAAAVHGALLHATAQPRAGVLGKLRNVRPGCEWLDRIASPEAAGDITHQLCEVLAGSREISPTQFHNSVHNAPSGYYSIAMKAKLGATSVCRGPWTFAAGLLGAAVQALCDDVPVLFVCYDSPLPAPLSELMPVAEATVIALVIAPKPAASPMVRPRRAVSKGRQTSGATSCSALNP